MSSSRMMCLFMISTCACSKSPSGLDASDAMHAVDAAACSEGATRCASDSTWQRCSEGEFVIVEACEWQCSDTAGCLVEENVCAASDDAIVRCTDRAPPDSFEPAVQWVFDGLEGEINAWTIPLVANLTDDNADGRVDLCDVPDVVIAATSLFSGGHLYILDGATGTIHVRVESVSIDATTTPALGDIDGDGVPEIVAANSESYLVALEADGTLIWTGDAPWDGELEGIEAVALADLDNDGDVEILHGRNVSDHEGRLLWRAPEPTCIGAATAAADLDGDGDLEVVLGHAAYHHDGSQYYLNRSVAPGFPQIANLDGDALPEILITNSEGITLLEHDGTTAYLSRRPTYAGTYYWSNWLRPATIHDFDGDGAPEFAHSCSDGGSSTDDWFAVYESDASVIFRTAITDLSGIAASTAFDFLGDGIAEAIYADEHNLLVFDGAGEVLLRTPRKSGTLIEYPVVADIDNDGSAEILVVSNVYSTTDLTEDFHTLQAIRDVEDRWIQARRIWNQHTYHVTNVREDGTIPRFEEPSWTGLNTYRTNAQIEGGGVCVPLI